MTPVDNAILLAAGLASRMRPLTDDTPKPLLLLAGRALLDHALDRLGAAGVGRVVVNAYWQADRLAAHLAARPGAPATVLRREDVLLDTGGAVVAALEDGLLDGPFFIVNGDTLWLDGPLSTLGRMRAALAADMDAAILVHRTFQIHAEIGYGDFFLDGLGFPRRRREREVAPYIYAGITLARPQLFAGLDCEKMSMNRVWDRAIAGGRLVAVVHDGLWFHMTRPDDVHEAEHALAAQLVGPTT